MKTQLFRRLLNRHQLCGRFVSSHSTQPLTPGLTSTDNYDTDYYSSVDNCDQIMRDIKLRAMDHKFADLFAQQNHSDKQSIRDKIMANIASMPNKLNPIWYSRQQQSSTIDYITVEQIGDKPVFEFEPKTAEKLLHDLGVLFLSDRKLGNLGLVGGKRSYAFFGDLARLESALIRWTMNVLMNEYDFTPVIVPQIVYSDVVSACGFEPFGIRSQVYTLKGDPRSCLSGTSEIPLAAFKIGEIFDSEDLPIKYCASSRCYRAEAKTVAEKGGLYRVHNFNKVEMFALTTDQQSDAMLKDFVDIQKSLFSRLGLCFKVIDMPPHELGVPAYQKFDIESWMSGRKFWGEISSASNCTDYQSRRLNIKYQELCINEETNEIFREKFVHTVNGTACATPRMIVTICEQYQTKDGHICIPEVLRPYMNGQQMIDSKPNIFKK